jgi:hypothetical protein
VELLTGRVSAELATLIFRPRQSAARIARLHQDAQRRHPRARTVDADRDAGDDPLSDVRPSY